MWLVTTQGDTLFISAAGKKTEGTGDASDTKLDAREIQQIPLCSHGHKAICLDFNYEGLWERGTLG